MYKRIKELRIKNNLTQAEISKKLGISQASYSLYERGKQDLSISVLLKLSRYYKTSPDYIVGDTDEPEAYGLKK